MEETKMRQLMEDAKKGKVEAFEILISAYQKKVYNIAYHFFMNHEDAQEMAQNAFLKAFQSICDFSMKSSFETWLYRITTNCCIDEKRKRQRNQTVSSDDETYSKQMNTYSNEISAEFYQPETTALQKELRSEIFSALEKLTPELRAVIVLKDIRDINYEEIAEILEIPLGTVKSRVHRARNALREIIVNEGELF